MEGGRNILSPTLLPNLTDREDEIGTLPLVAVCLRILSSATARDQVKKAVGGYSGWNVISPYDALVCHTVCSTHMQRARKITVEIPPELLKKAQQASGTGITQTVRTGLQLVAASRTYARLRSLRGKFRLSRTSAELKVDR
jgi:hypothetical protein